MPIPAGPAIAAAAQIASTGINAAATAKGNRKSRKFSREMYARQREDALSDWALMNDYNHPSAQMARLREAGLNPNLVYGGGSATQDAAAVRASTAQAYNPKIPQFDLGSAIGAYQDTRIRQAQTDNLRAQNTVLTQEALLKAAQTAKELANEKMSTFDRKVKEEMRSSILEKMSAEVKSIQTNTDYTKNRDIREESAEGRLGTIWHLEYDKALLQNAKTREEIEFVKEQLQNIRTDGRMKLLEENLRKEGINPTDPTWLRIMMQQAKKFGLF